MGSLAKSSAFLNLAVIILQICSLAFQIGRKNELVGSIVSVAIALLGFLPQLMGAARKRWALAVYLVLLFCDFVLQLVNDMLLIYFQWVVIQYCIHLNVSVDISEYAGIACNDWWHFGWGEINYRDRSLIVTILLSTVVLVRVVQFALTLRDYSQSSGRAAKRLSQTHL